MAATRIPFLDLLEDEVVQDIIRRIPVPQGPYRGEPDTSCVAATCSRLCTLVGC
jgi:hypothetical protein